jgi:NDP-sugar pyrophosphorylase family protein
MKALLHINPDNSKMRSKSTKEAQELFGKTVLNILKDTITKSYDIITKGDIKEESIMFFMGNVPLLLLDQVKSFIKQYEEDIVFFKDDTEAPIGLYISEKIVEKNIDLIKSDWKDFSGLLTELEQPYRVEILKGEVAVFSKHDLMCVTKKIQYHINYEHVNEGVTILDLDSVYIDFDVQVGMDTVLFPNTFLRGQTVIGEDCQIGPDARVQNSKIGDETVVKDSTILDSEVASKTSVGPYAYIRPNSKIGSNVKVGDFVEVKNATIGDGTKISHLAYVGDADVGDNVNVSCGVVFTNYDGKNKHRSTVKDNAFIGCNANLVAPVVVEELAYIAAGTTVTSDVPSGALAIGRSKQANKEGWVAKSGLIKKK